MQDAGQFALGNPIVIAQQRKRKGLRGLNPPLANGPHHDQAVEMHHPPKGMKYTRRERVNIFELRFGHPRMRLGGNHESSCSRSYSLVLSSCLVLSFFLSYTTQEDMAYLWTFPRYPSNSFVRNSFARNYQTCQSPQTDYWGIGDEDNGRSSPQLTPMPAYTVLRL